MCVVLVAWNKPPYKPIPASKQVIYKLAKPSSEEYSKTIIATLLKSIDLSRLKVTALDNSKNSIEKINMKD